MKAVFLALVFVLVPFVSHADDYCQPPPDLPYGDLPPIQELASSAAEVADDLIGSLECGYIQSGSWDIYTGLAGPPDWVKVTCYYSACPPDVDQEVIIMTRQWGDLEATLVHEGGWGQVWHVDVGFLAPVHIEGLTSLSIAVGGGGGGGGYGIVLTDQPVQGCEGYVAQTHGDWSPLGGQDVAFCISYGQPTPAGEVSWGRVKTLYR